MSIQPIDLHANPPRQRLLRGLLLSATMLGLLLALGCTADSSEEVVVYVAVDRAEAEPILQQYEQSSGVRVRAVYDAEAAKTTGLVTRLLAERNSPRCDVFWNNEIVQTMQLADQDLLAETNSPEAHQAAASSQPGQRFFQHVAVRTRVIVYNTELVSTEEVPRRLTDLTLPRWRGKVAIADPQFGTTRTHVAALYATWGPQRTNDYLNDLLANEIQIVGGNAMVKNIVGRARDAESSVVIGLTDTDDVLSGQADGMPIDMVYPDQDSHGTLAIPSTVCLLAKAPHGDQGQQLIDYLLSPAAAKLLTAPGTGYYRGTSLPKVDGQPIGTLEVPYDKVYAHLEASTKWTAAHFHQ